MFPKSIRWRLPLSYAAIALLAALALGLVLLLTLRSYYTRLELDYLNSNAREIGVVLGDVLQSDKKSAQAALNPQAQTKAFSFLSQTRVRVLSPQRQVLIDSGSVQTRSRLTVSGIPFQRELPGPPDPASPPRPPTSPGMTEMMLPPGSIAISNSLPPLSDFFIGLFVSEDSQVRSRSEEVRDVLREVRVTQPFTGSPVADSSLIFVNRSLYGFDLDPNAPFEARRSDQVAQQPFFDNQGRLRGYVELSEGPAYGRDIVEGVVRGWAIASAVAVLVAAGVGLVISRRISTPLVALTEVTSRMAEGDLTARTNIMRQDELGTLAKSFNEMADRVEDTVTTLRRFVSDAAHELNTPLTALKTNLELAAQQTSQVLPYLERSQEQLTRLETLTKSLLDLSRLEAGTTAGTGMVDVTALAKETAELYASRAEQAGLSFTLDLPDEGIEVKGNCAQLQQAIANLLDNAIRFTPSDGSVKLSVQRQRLDSRVEVSVEDTGIGIPVEDLPQLFARFHRGRNATAYPGNGLGLAIVKTIVESHGGEVKAENMAHGARFSFWLPIA